ncbi:MAG: nucleoside hydrolase [Granulosicoccus sp.]
MRHFIIDTDTASDDAVAIMMALSAPDIIVDAITIVAGNVGVRQGSINARYTLEVCRAQVPVYEGCTQPWLQSLAIADWFHGADGMGDMDYPVPAQAAEGRHAVNELIKRFRDSPGNITLVTLGPLTNIATALAIEPCLADWVKHCYIMGGAANTVGNVTPAAEYNIWCDPEAARKVLHSGMPITLLGWELSRDDATLSDAEMLAFRALATNKATVAMDCNGTALKAVREIQGEAGLALADPVAMSVAIDESIATDMGYHFVDIATGDELTRGMSVVDKLNVCKREPNARVCFAIDAARWKKQLFSALR